MRGAFRTEVLATTDALVINQTLLSNNKAKSFDTPITERPTTRIATTETNNTLIEIDVGPSNLCDLCRGGTGFAERNKPRCEREEESASAFVTDPLHFTVGEKSRWLSMTTLNRWTKQIDYWRDAEMIEFTQ